MLKNKRRFTKTENLAEAYWDAAERLSRAPAPEVKRCDHAGCRAEGLFRAPKSRAAVSGDKREYYFFCREHVEQYNKQWDFYAGLGTDEIDAAREQDVLGWRPTWPLGRLGGRAEQARLNITAEELRRHIWRTFFKGGAAGSRSKAGGPQAGGKADISAELRSALAVFELPAGVSLYEVKARYRQLVKQFHPDHTKEAAAAALAEAKIKEINHAYTILKKQFA